MYSSNTAQVTPLQAKKLIRSTLISRNVTVAGHRTSVRLEPDMWTAFNEICRRQRTTAHVICTDISNTKEEDTSLTAAIRVYIMNYYRLASTEDGHLKAGHGYNPAAARAPQPQNAQQMQQRGTTSASVSPAVAVKTASASSTSMQCKSSAPFMIGMGYMNRHGAIR